MTWSVGHIVWILAIAYCFGAFDWLAQLRDAIVGLLIHRPKKVLSKRERRRLLQVAVERDVGVNLLRRIAARESEGLPPLDTDLGRDVDDYLDRFDVTTTLRPRP